MDERPNFKKAPAADGKKQSFATRAVARLKQLIAVKRSKTLEDAKAFLTLQWAWQSRLRQMGGHAPQRKNGTKEMSRRVRQMAHGTHGL